ncbi:MAG: fibronectin type III domain-containing protein [Verrucomicrobiota bacterium]
MRKILHSLLAMITLATVAPAHSDAQTLPTWVDFQVEGDIAYLLRKSPAQIMRYDLNTQSWLSALPLAEIPDAFAIDSTHIFISYGRKIERIDKSGGNLTHVANTPDDVTDIFIDGNVLLAVRSTAQSVNSYDKTTFSLLESDFRTRHRLIGCSIAPGLNKVYGRSSGVSPSDIDYVSFDDTGDLLTSNDSPYHGRYPSASKTWVFPNETKVVDNSGTIYNASDLTYANSFGQTFDDLAFYGIDIPIVLDEDQLIAFSNTILETGRYTLSSPAQSITVSGSNVFAFTEDSGASTGVSVQIVPLASLTPNSPGAPIDPNGLAYEIDDSAIDASGIVYLLSKSFNSLFRWDINAHTYLQTIPLPEACDLVVYSEALNRLYVYAPSHKIYRIDLGVSSPTPAIHVNVPRNCNKLIPLGNDLLALQNGSWEEQWIYDQNGSLLLTPVDCCYHDFHFYDSTNDILYYDANAWPYLGGGAFGTVQAGSGSSGFTPIELSPNGLLMIDAGGVIYDASDRSSIDTLSNDIVKAQWNSTNQLFTLKEPPLSNPTPTITTVQRWTNFYAVDLELTVLGEHRELFSYDNKLLVVTSREGVPAFTTLDSAFDVLPPTSLDYPTLAIPHFSATAATLTWDDIYGEEEYVIERKLSTDSSWTEVGRVGIDTQTYTDLTLVTGFIYEFRIKAVNDGLSSSYSPVIQLDLRGVLDERVDPTTVTFVPDSVLISNNDLVYLLSEQHESIFVWDASQQAWGQTIPLLGGARFFTHSENNNALYTLYPDGAIYSIGLAATNPVEIFFAQLPAGTPNAIIAAGEFVAAGVSNTKYIYNATGIPLDTAGYYRIDDGVWNDTVRRIYHTRPGVSPNDILWDEILPDGSFGTTRDSPYHSSAGISSPVRVKPDGTIVLLGSGRIYDGETLEQIDALANPINDATWINGNLITMASDVIYSHTLPSYAANPEINLIYSGIRILPTSDDRLVVISNPGSGPPVIDIFSDTFSVSPPSSLNTPDNLSGAVLNLSTISLSWIDVAGEAEYRLERKLTGTSTWATIASPTFNTTAYSDSTVSVGNSYDYRITAINGLLESTPSSIVTLNLSVPAAPTNLLATAQSGTEVDVTWNDVSLESSYTVQRRLGPAGSWTTVADLPANSTSYSDSNLQPDTLYEYRVMASNGIGDSSYSNIDSATTDAIPPTVPTLNTPVATALSVSLSWTNSDYETHYVAERSPGGANTWSAIATNTADDTTYVDNTVSPLTQYDFRVKAVNNTGDSAYSNVQSVFTPALPLPQAPTSLNAKAVSASEIQISWNDVSVDQGYTLERRNEDPASWTTIATLPANTTSYSDTSVSAYTEFWYRVQAFNTTGPSSYSNTDSAIPADIVCVIEDDFDPGIDNTVWIETSGGAALNGGQGFLGSNALHFRVAGLRRATTVPVDVSLGGQLEFKMRSGNQSVDGNTYWNNSESGETVALEYSVDGINWNLIQSLDTVYPSLSAWADFSIEIPAGAVSPTTQFRWRQLRHSGNNYDCWALEDLCIFATAPQPPGIPPFIVATANSSNSIAVLWAGVPGAISYVIERTVDGQNWTEVAATPAIENYHTDSGLAAETFYSYRVKARNAGGDSDYSSIAFAATISQLDDWRIQNFGSSDPSGAAALTAVGPDGISNLLKFGSNLNFNDGMRYLNPDSGNSGLPHFYYDQALRKLCVEFVRRKGTSNPGITYHVEFCNSFGNSWEETGWESTVTSIDATFERVIWEDSETSDSQGKRFGRLKILAPTPP